MNPIVEQALEESSRLRSRYGLYYYRLSGDQYWLEYIEPVKEVRRWNRDLMMFDIRSFKVRGGAGYKHYGLIDLNRARIPKGTFSSIVTGTHERADHWEAHVFAVSDSPKKTLQLFDRRLKQLVRLQLSR